MISKIQLCSLLQVELLTAAAELVLRIQNAVRNAVPLLDSLWHLLLEVRQAYRNSLADGA